MPCLTLRTCSAPIARALIGKSKGETIEVEAQSSALNDRKRTGEGVRGIAKRFGVDPSTVQRGLAAPFDRVVRSTAHK
jgi:hypothetical protein